MPFKDTARKKFYDQQKRSRERGIDFHFTFEEWVAWWEEQLGPDWLTLRGTAGHQYAMGRIGDTGPYTVANVLCITASKNIADVNRRKVGELNPMFGRNHSEDAKVKMSENRKGVTLSPEHKAQLKVRFSGELNPMFGRTHSEEARKKISEARRKRNRGETLL